MDKLILALVMAARKLRPYFNFFRVVVVTEFPPWLILHGLNSSKIVNKWVIELGQHGLIYKPKQPSKVNHWRIS